MFDWSIIKNRCLKQLAGTLFTDLFLFEERASSFTMPRPVDGVHDFFHETTEHYTVEKTGSRRNTRAGVCSASTKSAPSTRCTATCCSSKSTLQRQRLVPVAKTGAGLSALKRAIIIKVSWRKRRPRAKKPPRLKGPALRVQI